MTGQAPRPVIYLPPALTHGRARGDADRLDRDQLAKWHLMCCEAVQLFAPGVAAPLVLRWREAFDMIIDGRADRLVVPTLEQLPFPLIVAADAVTVGGPGARTRLARPGADGAATRRPTGGQRRPRPRGFAV